MHLNDNRAVTLIEGLISILLLSVLLVSTLGAFYISKISTLRARHRIVAMNEIRKYMEQEIKAGCNGSQVDVNYYVTVPSATPINFKIDDRNTDDGSDDLWGTIRPSPYPASTTTVGTITYKKIGFIVEWNEDVFGTGTSPACSERVVTYVSEHS